MLRNEDYLHSMYKILKSLNIAKSILRSKGMNDTQVKGVAKILGDELALSRKISRLSTMQKYFKYWHVAHLPFCNNYAYYYDHSRNSYLDVWI